jgi:hypothetical protein
MHATKDANKYRHVIIEDSFGFKILKSSFISLLAYLTNIFAIGFLATRSLKVDLMLTYFDDFFG